jgi:hypothetical protein
MLMAVKNLSLLALLEYSSALSVTVFIAFPPPHSIRWTWQYFFIFLLCSFVILFCQLMVPDELDYTNYAYLSFRGKLVSNMNRAASSVSCSRWWWNWPMHADGKGVTIPVLCYWIFRFLKSPIFFSWQQTPKFLKNIWHCISVSSVILPMLREELVRVS